ncbi:MAG: hypothetical protein ACI81O_000672, partial [Cyclobacteriaceae bacterium]
HPLQHGVLIGLDFHIHKDFLSTSQVKAIEISTLMAQWRRLTSKKWTCLYQYS